VDGKILGLYNSGTEKTQEKISGRRSRLLHHIAAIPNFQQVSPWKHIVDACREYDRDVPLVAVYSVTALDTSSPHNCSLRLEGAFGIKDNHPTIPERLELADGTAGFVPALRLAKAKGSYALLGRPNDQLPEFLAHDVQWRGFGLPATHIVAMPLYATGSLVGFIIMGLNPKHLTMSHTGNLSKILGVSLQGYSPPASAPIKRTPARKFWQITSQQERNL
jgi:hypothetical protein